MVIKAAPNEVFDGAMLSDGHIASNHGSPYFKIARAGEDRIDWLNSIEEALTSLGIDTTGVKISDRVNYFSRKPYKCCQLLSKVSPTIKAARLRWYPGGTARVPSDLVVTSGLLAHWFMGDGSSTRLKGREFYVKASLCTQGYPDDDVIMLADKLFVSLNIGMSHNRVSRVNGRGLVLNSCAVSEVNKIMDAVEPFILPAYAYKIKRAFFSRSEMENSTSAIDTKKRIPAW